MFVYFLIAVAIGFEGGYTQPALGFDNLNSGMGFAVFIDRNFRITDMAIAAHTTMHQGKHPGYSLNFTGIRFCFYKRNWRFSPAIELGADYVDRELNKHREMGFAFDYCLGLMINFRVNQVRIYPKLFYDGVTDFKMHAGFVGIKFGVDYEI
jgi:hypothetical protein